MTAGSEDQWRTFVGVAIGDGEGPRFDALLQLLSHEAKSESLVHEVRAQEAANEALVDRLVDHLVASGLPVPDGSEPRPGAPASAPRVHGGRDGGLLEVIVRPGSGGRPV